VYLLQKEFIEKYLCWFAHGEPCVPYETMVERIVGSTYSSSNVQGVVNDNSNRYRSMVVDAMRIFQYFSILKDLYKKTVRKRYLTEIEFWYAHNYMLFKNKQRNMQEIKFLQARKAWLREGISDLHMLERYLGRLYLAHDVWAFLEAVVIQFKEPDQKDAWFHDHTYQQIHFNHFTSKANGKILFYIIIFFFNCCIVWKYLTDNTFILQVTVLRHDPRPRKRFVEIHIWKEDK
jgi:hypothetical protein